MLEIFKHSLINHTQITVIGAMTNKAKALNRSPKFPFVDLLLEYSQISIHKAEVFSCLKVLPFQPFT